MTIRHEVVIDAPVERCCDLARSVDLHVDSATEIRARAIGGRTSGLSGDGDVTTWSARFLGWRFSMTTRIEDYFPPGGFRDRLTDGMLRQFAHVYTFTARPDRGCVMSDELTVIAPFGPLGRVLERFYLAPRMRLLVRWRLEHIKRVAEGEEWQRYLG